MGLFGFNPRTRVGCDLTSIDRLLGKVLVSIHAPAWGATWTGRRYIPCGYRFNPRTRVGCDRQGHGQAAQPAPVSIHAPAWGATWSHIDPMADVRVSIHAPAWGATRA